VKSFKILSRKKAQNLHYLIWVLPILNSRITDLITATIICTQN